MKIRKKQAKGRIGSSLDAWLEAQGILDDWLVECTAVAIKRGVARQLIHAMKEQGLSKSVMARKMETSRSALDSLLDPNNGAATIKMIAKAARVLGKRVKFRLVG